MYLIDGNNVMAQRVGWHRDKMAARRGLLDELAQFALRARVRVNVVFDGAPLKHFADGSSYRGVSIFYAEQGSNADERIKKLAEASRERRTLIVVTSDRALSEYVRNCGARVMRSGEFRKRMEAAAIKDEDARTNEGESGVRGEEMTSWMRYFGVAPEDDE